jgi:hypothetical protein
VPGIERHQHVERLGATHLADHDPVGTHAQGIPHELPDGHLPPALDVRRPRLEPDDVGLKQAQLGGVLDRHDPFARRDRARQRAQGGRLPAARAAAHQDRRPALDRAGQVPRERLGQSGVLDEVGEREAAAAEAPDRQARAIHGKRRDHDIHARPVGHARVAHGRCVVDAPAERSEDPLDRMHELRRTVETGARRCDAPVTLHVHAPVAVHHHLVDGRIRQQWVQRPESRGEAENALGQPLSLGPGQRRSLGRHELAHLLLDRRVVGRRTRVLDQALAQRARQLLEGLHA